ncbi:MAG: DUF882 domain-containing protein [Myxococcales bacterium]|nr:DUF882 domain-containing protein [Myxococcales bacterium]
MSRGHETDGAETPARDAEDTSHCEVILTVGALLLLAALAPNQAWNALSLSVDPAGLALSQPASLLQPYLRPSGERFGFSPWRSATADFPLELARGCDADTPKPVSLRRGNEHDTLRLLDCNGGIAPDALDRVSILAREEGAARPLLPLPLTPVLEREVDDEWVDGVKLLRPRLLWMTQRLADRFPGRVITIYSGYRRDRATSRHRQGRALDISVAGVPNEELFRECRRFIDAACGFYPNSLFVHIDVRPPGTGHAVWIDVSGPGERAEYVDAWPGVLESGGLAWRRHG